MIIIIMETLFSLFIILFTIVNLAYDRKFTTEYLSNYYDQCRVTPWLVSAAEYIVR